MSARVPENCPICKKPVMPNERGFKLEYKQWTLVVIYWYYKCLDDNWFWANELQRSHNDREFNKAYKNRQIYG